MEQSKMKLLEEFVQLNCKRCGWNWLSRLSYNPRVCPKCKSYLWEKGKKSKRKIDNEEIKDGRK